MSFKRLFIVAALILVSSAAMAAQLVIPAAGTGPGAAGSRWQSEVTLHNAGSESMTLTLSYHDNLGLLSSFELTLAPRTTTSIADIVLSRFGRSSGTGAIAIEVSDVQARKLVVTSRTLNVSTAGEMGQDIPALAVTEAAVAGDTGVINGPFAPALNRFNFGIFTLEPTTVEWRLLRRDGSIAAEKEVVYAAGIQTQYSSGVATFLGATPEANDVLHARVKSGRALFYGSIINNKSNDPSFVPAGRARENLAIRFLGVDVDGDDSVDVADANGDGILDGPVAVAGHYFPNFFRVVTSDPEGATLTYTLVNAPSEARLVDANGTVQWWAPISTKGQTTMLKVRVSDGFSTSELTIPVVVQ